MLHPSATLIHVNCCSIQDVFLMIRRDKTTIFLDATEEITVADVKKKLEGITKKETDELRLYNVNSKEPLDDNKTLGDCGFKAHNAKAQDPAAIGLVYRISKFEKANIGLFSIWLCVFRTCHTNHIRRGSSSTCSTVTSDSLILDSGFISLGQKFVIFVLEIPRMFIYSQKNLQN